MSAQNFFNGKTVVSLLFAFLLYLIYSYTTTHDFSYLYKLFQQVSKIAVSEIEKEVIPEKPIEPTKEIPSVAGASTGKQVAQVVKVIDGDTIEVELGGLREKIRIIGLNTPETVDPRRGVECFGQEASDFAKQTLSGKTVYLEADPSQAERDKYGRLLRFVFLNEGSVDFSLLMIQEGFGYEYTYDLPYKYQASYKQAQQEAQTNKKGLWADTVCPN